ncbi:hypothetical protein B1748_31020 [Paenibacillus sp. MY03]|uniref:SGNH/GDSL hydrolase family protein n=1 Tax=Paenibacillus sp. MY03 TaxID=302980 RepID=UPI000B3C44D5|nr:SGNH/GDSL hydrolase family protein [Paenibacillus sp. MY03]OUS69598.1 hypothetical protein B1748_31020 [Paenibacillus sp. MY03]
MDELHFFAKYACNLTAENFPSLTGRRRTHVTTDTEVLLLGDSHGWGQGSPEYDDHSASRPHMAAPYSNGFFSKLRQHIIGKYGWYVADSGQVESSHPLAGFAPVSGGGKVVRMTRPISDKYDAAGIYAPRASEQDDREIWGYLATDHKFSEELIALPSRPAEESALYWDMTSYATKLYIGAVASSWGARLEVSFEPYGASKGLAAGYVYPPREGYPQVTRLVSGRHAPAVGDEVEVLQGQRIVIDTYFAGGEAEVVYCIDFGQKQKGRLRFAQAGANTKAKSFEPEHDQLSCPIVALRGVVFDGNNVRNFSMGGHTVGQWLGDGTPSYNDESQAHMDQLLRYVPFTPTLVVIQAPIVNEYLRQTPLAVFTSHLHDLTDKLSRHLNMDGKKRTDFLFLTTPGDKRIMFQNEPSAPIRYEDYYESAREFARASGAGFIDFAQYFESCVHDGILDYELLFDDPIHPSPFVNEFIARRLSQAIDLLM